MAKSKKQTHLVRNLAVLVLIVSTSAAAVLAWLACRELSERKQSRDFYASVQKIPAKGKEQPEFSVPSQNTAAAPIAAADLNTGLENTHPEQMLQENAAEPTVSLSVSAASGAQELHRNASEQSTDVNWDDGPQTVPTEPTEQETETTASFDDWDHWCVDQRHRKSGTDASSLDFEAIRKSYPDCVGWLEIEGLNIDMPVVQGQDNGYYLEHLPNRQKNPTGSLMMDYGCRSDFHSDITTIHGHHLASGAMFGSLAKYDSRQFWEEYPTFRLYTPDGDCEVEVVAACTLNGEKFGYPPMLSSEKHFRDYVNQICRIANYSTGVVPQWGDRLLLLSTCAYSFEDARFLVLGVLR